MAKVTYEILDTKINSIPENETYTSSDLKLVDNFQVNRTFDYESNFIEAHFYSINNERLYSIYDYNLPVDGNNIDLEDGSAGEIYIKPEELAVEEGFSQVDLKMVFHFLDDLFGDFKTKESFYIQDISSDRTELFLQSKTLDRDEIVNIAAGIKEDLTAEGYFEEFWLNFGENDLYIATNIDTLEIDGKVGIVIKLYEPLPSKYNKKATLQLVEKVSDSIAVIIKPEVEDSEVEEFAKLRQANFNIEVEGKDISPTEYFNYNDLFGYSNNNSNRELYSLIKENSVAINIDYSDYDNFINFSSAEERLKNFRYKVRLLETYQSSLDSVNSLSSSTNTTSGSVSYYESLIEGVVNNFDHYERHLYYSSGSTSWPKSTTLKPYTNYHSTSSEAVSWYAQQLTSASNYDTSNYDLLSNTLPSYIAEDSNNSNGVLFVHMIGQHFDNLWIYTKAVTDKYDADNRIDVGVSKDLVQETLKSFGVKLYNSIESSDNLFKYLIGNTYDSGSYNEVVNTFVDVSDLAADIQPVSRKNYEGEVYKRIYHNLPFLMKSKGTERGLRALINCFGIPSDFLAIKQYGGQVVGEDKFIGYENEVTSSVDKIRIETRASGSVGKVLAQDKSIQKKEVDRTQDINRLEVGFSPADSINTYILSQLPSSFNIDDYIGDPRDTNESNYTGLLAEAKRALLASTDRPQLNDFIRILKFYDNVLFKMVRDFVPAKATVDTGIIIKPHILDRSKAKVPTVTATEPNYSGSMETAFTTGSHGGAYYISQLEAQGAGLFRSSSLEGSTIHNITVQTKSGSLVRAIDDESPQYNGELSGSELTITSGELNDENVFKKQKPPVLTYNIVAVPLDVASLTGFSMYDATGSSDSLACQVSGDTSNFYHSGTTTVPSIGDIVYTDSAGSNTLNGGGNWWHISGFNIVIQIAGSGVTQGEILDLTNCNTFDNTAPSGYKASWTQFPFYVNSSTDDTILDAKIYGGELGTTYFASASMNGALSSNTSTGTITNAATQSISVDASDINTDGTLFLNVRLADGNQTGSLATVAGIAGSSLNLTKDTTAPTVSSVRFVNYNYSSDETTNNTGNFFLKVEGINSQDSGLIYWNLASTGGGSVNGTVSYSGVTFKNISISSAAHNMNSGTVTATVYLKDNFNNQSSNVTDTNSYTAQSGTITSPNNALNLTGNGDGFNCAVNVTPNTLTWSITTPSWIGFSGASGVGDDASIAFVVDANPSTTSSRTGTITLKTGNTTLDSFTVVQNQGSGGGGGGGSSP